MWGALSSGGGVSGQKSMIDGQQLWQEMERDAGLQRTCTTVRRLRWKLSIQSPLSWTPECRQNKVVLTWTGPVWAAHTNAPLKQPASPQNSEDPPSENHCYKSCWKQRASNILNIFLKNFLVHRVYVMETKTCFYPVGGVLSHFRTTKSRFLKDILKDTHFRISIGDFYYAVCSSKYSF